METLANQRADSVTSQKRSGTVLFADVAGFTSIAERLGEEAAFEIIQELTAAMRQAIIAHGGTIGEFRGDGIMALFGVTSGLEEGPLRACKAALNIQQSVKGIQARMVRQHGEAPQLRIGLHCGPLVVGDVGGDNGAHVTIIGDAANVASRLETAAAPGQILISKDLYRMVDGLVAVRDLGPIKVKGKTRPLEVFQLESVHENVSRFDLSKLRGLSTFLDRDTELGQLADVFEGAADGHICVAHIKGEAGIGKSRLVYEFEQRLPEAGVRVIKGDCHDGGQSTPFEPFAELLRNTLSLERGATAEACASRIDRMLENMGFDKEETRPYLMAMLGKATESDEIRGKSPDMIGARMRQVIMNIIRHLTRESTVVLIIEDLHWADGGTEQVIDQLINGEDTVPLMILCTCRPTYLAPWRENERVTFVTPAPISEKAIDALIREVMSGSDQSPQLAALAIEKADGNPLYAEEIAKFIIQQQDDLDAAEPGAELVLPANLQNMVMERFDRLEPECSKLLQSASAMGRKFDARVAHQVLHGNDDFDLAMLDSAIAAELVHPTGQSDNEFRFKHALVQDAIYDTLLVGQRRGLHARIASELETRFDNRPEEAAESLAWHFDQADMPEKAAPHLIVAGMRNLNLFSLDAANRAFARAFELIETHEIDLTSAQTAMLFAGWFEVQQWRAEFGRTVSLFESQGARLQNASSDPRYARILGLAGVAYCQNMEFDMARKQLDEAIAIGERTDDHDAIVYGCLGLMVIECTAPQSGYWERNHALIARINDLLGDDPQPYYRTYCTFYECWSHTIRGDFDFPIPKGHELFELGRKINFSGAVGWGAICIAYNEAQSENYETAIKYASLGADEAGGLVDKMVCLAIKGFSMLMTPEVDGNLEEGTRILNEIADLGDKLDYRGVENMVDGPVGLAMVLGGDLGGGVRQIRAAIDNAMTTGNLNGAAMSHISLGMIYLLLATGTEKPDLKSLRKNFMFLLREVPFAKSKAIAHFDAAIALGHEVDMFGVIAQAQLGKSEIMKARKKPDLARDELLKAREALKSINWSMMEKRVDQALADIG